ncbi:MAG: NTP transferase domain-containing protein, partial [Thermodesulfobacteriota bacterium]
MIKSNRMKMKNQAVSVKNFPLILLAAGRSSRMGTPKGLLDFQGRPWLVVQLQRFKAAGGRRAIIVLGFHYEHYREHLPWLEEAGDCPVRQFGLEISVVLNTAPEEGQFSSLQCAISFLLDGKINSAERGRPASGRSAVRPPKGGLIISSAEPSGPISGGDSQRESGRKP